VAHNQSLADVQDLLEENVQNIRRRLKFRATIEENLQKGLEEVLPVAKSLKIQIEVKRSSSHAPENASTKGANEPTTSHP